jgi:hypothetical protein
MAKLLLRKTGLKILGLGLLVLFAAPTMAKSKSSRSIAVKKVARSVDQRVKRRAPASTGPKAPATRAPRVAAKPDNGRGLALARTSGPANDPNRSIEIRGQSRTLSMMLVLKNDKDSINFIKVRKDYNPEILATEF